MAELINSDGNAVAHCCTYLVDVVLCVCTCMISGGFGNPLAGAMTAYGSSAAQGGGGGWPSGDGGAYIIPSSSSHKQQSVVHGLGGEQPSYPGGMGPYPPASTAGPAGGGSCLFPATAAPSYHFTQAPPSAHLSTLF